MRGGAGREALQGGDICPPVTDSRCTAETNTTVKSSYTHIKHFFLKRRTYTKYCFTFGRKYCLWRLLARITNLALSLSQSILKEINPEYSLEGLMLELKLRYFGHLMQRADSIRKDPDAGKD